jgi:DNA-binding LacI/PurR family transcriptional regulator
MEDVGPGKAEAERTRGEPLADEAVTHVGSKKYASSTDVARLAGVSQSAVSRTYRDGASVSEATRKRVLEAARELDYRPSFIPRIMLTHRSNLVAVVIGGMYNPFYSTVLEEFTVKLQAAGHQVLLVHAPSDHALDAVIPKLASYRVDAVVSALAVLSSQSAQALAKLRIPVVSFNTARKNQWISAVSCDNVGAARSIADLFVERGARSFGFVSGPSASHAGADRLRGYRARLMERGLGSALTIERGDFRYEGGMKAVANLYRGGVGPHALFCANDLLAIGAIDGLRKAGLRVPEDVLIAGFDDIPAASWASYDLTTFLQDAPRMVDEAIRILGASESGKSPAHEDQVVVPARLIERGTTLAGSLESA